MSDGTVKLLPDVVGEQDQTFAVEVPTARRLSVPIEVD